VQEYTWEPQPRAAEYVNRFLAEFCERLPDAGRFARRLLDETGTRLIDWTDHIAVTGSGTIPLLHEAGFVRKEVVERNSFRSAHKRNGINSVLRGPETTATNCVWEHPGGLFPQIVLAESTVWRLALRVESVADFLVAQGMSDVAVEGPPLCAIRKARVAKQGDAEMWVVERHGFAGWEVPASPSATIESVLWHQETLRRRKRRFARPDTLKPEVQQEAEDGFEHTMRLIRAAVADLGTGWASDLFFTAEREYWTRRNRAARVQKARQDALGLGWQNHDHHTYRSSRGHFASLVRVLEQLGMTCRERFYAGREAGWGAQVLEQPQSGIVVFADVDLGPEEVVEDFAHQPLRPRDEFGTVGLWCLLHGEAILEAGLHHLECRFDFDAARQQLERAGVPVLKPFTDLPYLKQAFTEGVTWPVAAERLAAALAAQTITPTETERFRQCGAIGSHLEILQRDQGYKGFNQAGINDIIRATDPRRQSGDVSVAGA
jgi:hypothetical protein